MFIQEKDFSLFFPQSELEMFNKVVGYLEIQPGVEEILVQPSVKLPGRIFRPDLLLPHGCPALGFRGRTAIDLKVFLGAATLQKVFDLFMDLRMNDAAIDCFVVIYEDRNEFPLSLLRRYQQYRDRGFFVYAVSSFCKLKTQEGVSSIGQYKAKLTQGWDKDEQFKLLEDAHNAFITGRNTLFLGAGLGKSINMPDWEELLKGLLNSIYLESPQKSISESDYKSIDESFRHSAIITGRYIEKGFDSDEKFKEKMRELLYQNHPEPNSLLYQELVRMIQADSPNNGYYVDQAITFNYDDLLETAIDNYRKANPEKKIRSCNSVFNRAPYIGNGFPVYHVHGMIPQKQMIKSTPVLGEQEYHKLYKEAYHWSNVVQLFALSRSTCIFVGLSMTDPNLRRLLDISRKGGFDDKDTESNPGYHYAIVEKVPLDKDNVNSVKNNEHYRNQERMMEDLGIKILWYNHKDHGKIVDYLRFIRTGSM